MLATISGFGTTLAEQRIDDLRRDAELYRLAKQGRQSRRSGRRSPARGRLSPAAAR
jgi:hypothetical protein